MQKYRESVQLENEINAFQGLQENGVKFINETIKEGLAMPFECNSAENCLNYCDSVKDKFNKELNKQMAYDIADYDTKKERFVTRLISGFTAALFLGNDFYNKAIQKGKPLMSLKKNSI